MVFGSGGVCIVQDGGQSVAGRFAQFYIALDNGAEHQFLEVAFYFIVYLVGLSQARIVHGQQESFDFECGVQLGLDDFDGVQSLLMPSSAKYSACTGMMTESAAVSALIVISPNDGEQSIKI